MQLHGFKYSNLMLIIYAIIWFQVFLCNINNFYTIIWFQEFLSNTNNFYTIIRFHVFLSNTNNFYTIIWFQVLSDANNLCNYMVSSNYSCSIIISCLHVVMFQELFSPVGWGYRRYWPCLCRDVIPTPPQVSWI